MKKNKLTLGIVSSLVGVLALGGCSSVTSSKENIVSFVGYDGNEIGIVTDKAYEEFLNTPNGIQKFYDAIMETLIRYQFQHEGSPLYEATGVKSYDQIVVDAKRKVQSAKDEAKKAAKDNSSTTYDKEWEAKLESEGVEDEKELLEKYIYAEEKEEAEDWYLDQNKANLTTEFIGVTKTGTKPANSTAPAKFPYHIRHILVSIAGGASDYTRGTITEGEALNLTTVISALEEGILDFGDIAKTFSGDTGSAAKYGSVGIMTTDTAFVNEFKLGIYAYDAALSGNSNTVIEEGLGLNNNLKDYKTGTTTTVKQQINNIGLTRVPYDVFNKIDETKAETLSAQGLKVNEGNESYYPRNIWFNKYVNLHNPFVISNQEIKVDTTNDLPTTSLVTKTMNNQEAGKCGFRSVPGVTTGNEKILTDEKGNPIIGVRSEHGIHLMIMEKSVYDYDNANVSLEDYYTTYTPNDAQFPTGKDTYVTYRNPKEQSVLNERAEEVEKEIKNFDPSYEYRLFEYFVENGNITFGSIFAQEQIELFIAAKRLENEFDSQESLEKAWRTYLELIQQQNYERGRKDALVLEGCAIAFKDAHKNTNGVVTTDELFKEGGACYYAN